MSLDDAITFYLRFYVTAVHALSLVRFNYVMIVRESPPFFMPGDDVMGTTHYSESTPPACLPGTRACVRVYALLCSGSIDIIARACLRLQITVVHGWITRTTIRVRPIVERGVADNRTVSIFPV